MAENDVLRNDKMQTKLKRKPMPRPALADCTSCKYQYSSNLSIYIKAVVPDAYAQHTPKFLRMFSISVSF